MKQVAREILVMLALMATILGPVLAGQATKEKPLFDRLGGKDAITAVVDEFVARVAADKRINRYSPGWRRTPER
jgi:hemoglobin